MPVSRAASRLKKAGAKVKPSNADDVPSDAAAKGVESVPRNGGASVGEVVIAQYNFDGNKDGDLKFRKGDLLIVLDRSRDPNWWLAKSTTTGQTGVVPANYVINVSASPVAAPAAPPKAVAASPAPRAPSPPTAAEAQPIPEPVPRVPAEAGPVEPPSARAVAEGDRCSIAPVTLTDARVRRLSSIYIAERSPRDLTFYHGSLSREESEALLGRLGARDGMFLLRDSTKFKGDFTLSVSYKHEVQHYRIRTIPAIGSGTSTAYTIDGEGSYGNIAALLEYHRQDSNGLCTRLRYAIVRAGTEAITRSLFAKAGWEVPREELQLGSLLGTGDFGDVFEAQWRGQTVAVKQLRSTETTQQILAEASFMTRLDHPNLVRLLGVCVESNPILLITEFAKNRSLLDYLRSRGREKLPHPLLLKFARQICAGMAYLESKRFVHRDLSARNVLVTECEDVKVSDFGLARPDNHSEADRATMVLPIRWTAPEAIESGVFTSRSDVWSFGIVLWEIFSFGRVPYARMDFGTLHQQVRNGYRLDSPEGCPLAIYAIMRRCWDANAASRPSFEELKSLIPQLEP